VPGALTPLVPFADGTKWSPFENAIQLTSSQADPDVKISAVTSAMGGSAWDDGWHRPRRWVAARSAIGVSDSGDRWQCDRRWVTPRAAMGGSASRDGWQRDRRWVSVTPAIGDSAIGDRWQRHLEQPLASWKFVCQTAWIAAAAAPAARRPSLSEILCVGL
jgi:hypothetical protein